MEIAQLHLGGGSQYWKQVGFLKKKKAEEKRRLKLEVGIFEIKNIQLQMPIFLFVQDNWG